MNCLSSLDLFISLWQTSFSLSIQILYYVLEAAAKGKILYFNIWTNAEGGSQESLYQLPTQSKVRRGPREKIQWRLLKEAWEKQQHSAKRMRWTQLSCEWKEWNCRYGLLLFPKVISFWGQKKKKKIWKNCRSEDIQVHQCWEVFPKVLLPSSEIRSSHVVHIGTCCILSPNKLQYQFPWCHHMSSHWSLNCFTVSLSLVRGPYQDDLSYL